MLKREFVQSFLFALLYGLVFLALQLFFHQRTMVAALPDEHNLPIWDASYYREIAEHGYKYHPDRGSNSAFYFLFPLVWKLSHLGAIGISFINIFFFAAGFAFTASLFKLSSVDKFIWLSIPSFFIAFVPYSEALFIFLTSVLFWAITRQRLAIAWISLLLLSWVRPVAMTFIPALLIVEVLCHAKGELLKAIRKFIVWYGLPLVVGTIFFIWYQYHETGVWFAFFKQERHWDHELKLPQFPLSSINGPVMLWLNALALFIGFVSLMALVVRGLQWLRARPGDKDRVLLFSFLYLTAVLFITLLFSSTWGHGKTNVYDAHRYAMATPFFWVFLHHYLKERTYTFRDFVVVFIVSNLFWLPFASYMHIMLFVYFGFNTAIIMLYMGYANKPASWPSMAIAAFNFFVQVFSYQLYLSGVSFM